MIICELSFDRPDPDNPNYSLEEVDYYAWIPANAQVPNHRLSLRKNLVSGKFEVYRRYFEKRTMLMRNLIVATGDDTGLEQVPFEGTFEEALRFAHTEYEKYHEEIEPDKPCQHEYPNMAITCPNRRGLNEVRYARHKTANREHSN
jgi:hypothetical protein